jgi:AcrR family transcriptional regulator
MTSDDPAPEARATTWRELAVARSLDPARVRAENRVQRFLDAAMGLMNDGTGRDFTVQEVVERSGQSLRSFYQYFGGKHELLLALFEELVRTSADHLRAVVADVDDPLERLHRFVVEYHRMCRPARKGKAGRKPPAPAVMVDFGQQLLTAHPAEAARAHAPMVSLMAELLDGAAAAGAIRADVRRDRVAGIVLEAIMFNAFSMTIAAASDDRTDVDPGEELWDVVFNGIGAA